MCLYISVYTLLFSSKKTRLMVENQWFFGMYPYRLYPRRHTAFIPDTIQALSQKLVSYPQLLHTGFIPDPLHLLL